ncbi:MAG: hypothetical protein ACK5JD_10145 [Mangrovibacterium sp.]
MRSLRAAEAARTSTNLKIFGVAGSALMMAQSGTKIIKGKAAPIDVLDFSVGSAGFTSGIVELGRYNIPYVGQGIALYGWTRLWLDIGYNYGISARLRQNNKSEIIEYMRKNGY